MKACSADFRGVFVLFTALSLSFLLAGLSPSCYDNFFGTGVECWIQMQTYWYSCEASGILGDSFGHCTTSECALCDFSLPAEPVPRLILKMCSVYFVFQLPDTAHLCVSLSSLQFYFLCCCTTKRQKDWSRLMLMEHTQHIFILDR